MADVIPLFPQLLHANCRAGMPDLQLREVRVQEVSLLTGAWQHRLKGCMTFIAARTLLGGCGRSAAALAQPSANLRAPPAALVHLLVFQCPHSIAACHRAICSAIDKLDKAEWPEVRQEMVDDKG